jgi:hypothetical protein
VYPPGTRWVSEEFFQKLIIITIRCVQRNITFLKKTITTIPNLRNHDSLGIEGPKKKRVQGVGGGGVKTRGIIRGMNDANLVVSGHPWILPGYN